MRYFVTGATGFIGGRVARMLVDEGHTVVALVRDLARAAHLEPLGIELHIGDITDRDTLVEPMRDADGIFHMAAWYEVGVSDTSPAVRINVDGTRNVLEVMRELGIPRGVYTSTLAVFSDTKGTIADESYHADPDGPWASAYDRTKYLAHYQVALPMMRAGLPLIIVQPGLTYGPDDPNVSARTLRDYLQGRLPAIPSSAAFAWAHVDDIARGHLLAMEQGTPGESYIIAGPIHTLEEALGIAEEITGIPAPSLKLSRGLMHMMASVTGALGGFLPIPENYRAETLRSAAGTYIASNEKARRELGYEPRPLEEGLRETLEYEMARLGIVPR